VALVLVGACAADDAAPVERRRQPGIVVASFDFAESLLLGEIYAQALEDEGVEVVRQLGLGPRELVGPALRQGFIDVVPEYAGSALDAAAPGADVDPTDLGAVTGALADAVAPWGVGVLAPAAAANQNGIAVPRVLADRHQLETISDLQPIAGSLTLGGPPECAERSRCLLGLEDLYGLRFASFVPLATQEFVRRALDDGVVDVGLLFTTEAALAGSSLVLLEDDRRLQPVENVVPVVRQDVLGDGRVARVLDEVSRALTTPGLRFLNWRVAHAGTSVGLEARGWLVRHGLVSR
jgi:osmoprotectant transport system substrate-binding protein